MLNMIPIFLRSGKAKTRNAFAFFIMRNFVFFFGRRVDASDIIERIAEKIGCETI